MACPLQVGACAKVAALLLVQAAAWPALLLGLQQAWQAAAYQSFAAPLVYVVAAAGALSQTGCVAGSALPGWRAAALPASALLGYHAALLQVQYGDSNVAAHISLAMWYLSSGPYSRLRSLHTVQYTKAYALIMLFNQVCSLR